jgi:hypothetical protein
VKLGIYGPGRAGKDEVAHHLVDAHGFRYYGPTSFVIASELARRTGRPFDELYGSRHADRETWATVGDELRRDDPAFLARKVLERGDLVVGVRRRIEARAIRGLLDAVWWIERPGIPDDPTLDFGPEECDLVLRNDGALGDLHTRIDSLIRDRTRKP